MDVERYDLADDPELRAGFDAAAEPDPPPWRTDPPELASELASIVEGTHLNPYTFNRAHRFVVGEKDDAVVGFASLRYTSLDEELYGTDAAVECYELAVRDQDRGEGLGEALFEEALDEAETMLEDMETSHVYLEVQDRPTELYREVADELADRGELTGTAAVERYCEEEGIDTGELYEKNEPMHHLAERYGFETVEEGLGTTGYVRELG